MSDFDIDSSIANLERKLGGSSPAPISTGISHAGSSTSTFGAVKHGVIASVLAGAILYLFKPMWLYSIKFDEKTEKCKPRLRVMKAVLSFLVLTAVLFFIAKRVF